MTSRPGVLAEQRSALSNALLGFGPALQTAATASEGPTTGKGKDKTRACTTCARLKMKCKWSDHGQESCVRCSRMNLSCTVPEPTQRRTRGKGTRVAQLEKKIDGLVTLLALQSQHDEQPAATLAEIGQLENDQQTANLVPQLIGQPQVVNSAANGSLPHLNALRYPQRISSSIPDVFEYVPGLTIKYADADQYLTTYREEFVPKFPFIPISPDATALSLHRESPFLFLSIMRVTTPQSSAIQIATKQWFLEQITDQVIIKSKPRLEHLQGILVQLAWGDFHYAAMSQVTHVLQLAVGLAVDLRLTKPPGWISYGPKSFAEDACDHKMLPMSTDPHSLDEIRAALGAFFINSLMAVIWRRDHTMKFTSYLTKCCERLQNAHDNDDDLYLVTLVRFQRLSERVQATFPDTDMPDDDQLFFQPALDMALQSLRKELDDTLASLPPVVKTYPMLMLHYNHVLNRLYEPTLFLRPCLSPPTYSDHPRIAALWSCLEASQSVLTSWLAVPVSYHVFAPSPSMAFPAFALITATRLLLGGHTPAWDAALARTKIDLPGLCDRTADKLELVNEAARTSGRRWKLLGDGTPTVQRTAEKLRWIRNWFLSRVAAEEAEEKQRRELEWQRQQPQRLAGQVEAQGRQQGLEGMNMAEFPLDDEFWRNMMMTDAIFFGGCSDDPSKWCQGT